MKRLSDNQKLLFDTALGCPITLEDVAKGRGFAPDEWHNTEDKRVVVMAVQSTMACEWAALMLRAVQAHAKAPKMGGSDLGLIERIVREDEEREEQENLV